MRLFYFLFLVAFTGAAAFLAYENRQDVTLTVFNRTYSVMVAALVGLAYLAGMLSGWTIVGLLRRSFSRVTSEPLPGERRGQIGYTI
jgi:putative copper export protein